METSEIKPASRRAGLWAHLSDPDQWPRCWWFPPSSRRDVVLQMSEEARQNYRQVVQQAHEKFSETVRLAMLSLLGFALFCLLITFSAPDSSLLVADPTIKMPFADVQVSFQSFLILGPLLLIIVTLYLHIFYGYWLDLERDYQHLTRSCKSSELSIERLPTLFSLDHPVPRLLTDFIFYWLMPLVLLAISWKAAARVEWGVPLVFLTGLVTVILIFLQIRRRPAFQRRLNPLRWGVIGLIVSCMAGIMVQFAVELSRDKSGIQEMVVVPQSLPRPLRMAAMTVLPRYKLRYTEAVVVPQWLPRPLNIVRVDLKGRWLAEVNLRDASASLANFEEANLERAQLEGADLQGANLRKTNLQWARLQQARLQGANLQDANLQGVDLVGMNLQGVTLQGANLQDANLLGVTDCNRNGLGLQSARFRDRIICLYPSPPDRIICL